LRPLATREVVEPESARIIGAMIPPERGHLVIATDDVNADVVRETAGSVDDQGCEVRVKIALKVPDCRGGGDSGSSGEQGEDGGELHFEWGCRLEFECQAYIYIHETVRECCPERLTEVGALLAEAIICLRVKIVKSSLQSILVGLYTVESTLSTNRISIQII